MKRAHAALVGLGIEDARATAGRATSSPSGFLVLAFWDGDLDASLGQEPAVGRRGVCLVGQHPVGTGTRAATTGKGDPDAVEHGDELRAVPALPTGQQHRQRFLALFACQVQLRGQAAT